MMAPKNKYNYPAAHLEALRVATDAQLEREPHPIGHLMHYSTVTHAWRGVLEAVTASDYVLAPGASLFRETGPMADYSPRTKPDDGDGEVPYRVRVARGAVAWSVDLGVPS